MAAARRQTWRASGLTLAAVGFITAGTLVVLPGAAYLIHERRHTLAIPITLCALGMAIALYAWRFGLHPRIRADDSGIRIANPLRRYRFEWEEITVIAPGPNGLIIASPDQRTEAWCVQKSNYATRRGLRRRADEVAGRLLDLLDLHDPPVSDDATGLRLRRARPGEEELLTRLERAANETALRHIFPPEQYPYPVDAVRARWQRVLQNRQLRTRVLELLGAPVGFVAFSDDTIAHLGVVRHQTRRGFGSALLEYATEQIFDGAATQAQLWVLSQNVAARSFYRHFRWQDTDDHRRSEYPPHPEEMLMVKANPRAPRHSRS